MSSHSESTTGWLLDETAKFYSNRRNVASMAIMAVAMMLTLSWMPNHVQPALWGFVVGSIATTIASSVMDDG